MAALTLDLTSTINPKDFPPTGIHSKGEVINFIKEHIPANWDVKSTGGNNVRAVSEEGDIFQGSITDLNKIIRG